MSRLFENLTILFKDNFFAIIFVIRYENSQNTFSILFEVFTE